MALTRKFKETVRERAQKDQKFRIALFQEAVECLLEGDVDTGRQILSDYVNATIGYKQLGMLLNKDSKSLMRMLGPKGNPSADNLFGMISQLKKQEGVKFELNSRTSS